MTSQIHSKLQVEPPLLLTDFQPAASTQKIHCNCNRGSKQHLMSYNALCYAEKKPGRTVITVKHFYMLIIENEQDMHLCIRFLLRSQINASLCLFRYAVKEHWQDSRNISVINTPASMVQNPKIREARTRPSTSSLSNMLLIRPGSKRTNQGQATKVVRSNKAVTSLRLQQSS
jgi:hypothetical protein